MKAAFRRETGPYKLKTLTRLLDLDEELQSRLVTCAEETNLPGRSLIRMAIDAAVGAIEESNYRLVLPMEFIVRYIPKRDLPAINPDLIDIDAGMRVGFGRRP